MTGALLSLSSRLLVMEELCGILAFRPGCQKLQPSELFCCQERRTAQNVQPPAAGGLTTVTHQQCTHTCNASSPVYKPRKLADVAINFAFYHCFTTWIKPCLNKTLPKSAHSEARGRRRWWGYTQEQFSPSGKQHRCNGLLSVSNWGVNAEQEELDKPQQHSQEVWQLKKERKTVTLIHAGIKCGSTSAAEILTKALVP